MNRRRTLDEHFGLFAAFSREVAHLSPASWQRVYARCADLDDSAFRALLDRAFLAARPYALWEPATMRHSTIIRVLASVSRGVQISLAITAEVLAEFDRAGTDAAPARPRTKSSGKPRLDAMIDANFTLDATLKPRERDHPGVATAVRAAAQAVLRHDWLSAENFDAVYRYVEPEIPFATLTPGSDA